MMPYKRFIMATFIFIAKEGKMSWETVYNHERFLADLRQNEGRAYRIEPLISTRSMSQNSLYHLFLDVICRETGNDHNNLHEYLKRELLPPKFIKVKIGKELNAKEIERKIPASTIDLTKLQFVDYMDKISALVGVQIPDTDNFLNWRDSGPLAETYQG